MTISKCPDQDTTGGRHLSSGISMGKSVATESDIGSFEGPPYLDPTTRSKIPPHAPTRPVHLGVPHPQGGRHGLPAAGVDDLRVAGAHGRPDDPRLRVRPRVLSQDAAPPGDRPALRGRPGAPLSAEGAA